MKILSLTFDDGFLATAQKVDKLISPYKATFYIVTGWVRPNCIPINDPWNNRDHGSLDDWIALSRAGHDIQSHTVSHHNIDWYNKATDEEISYEYEESLNFIKKIHGGPYTLSTPFHHVPRIAHGYMAVRLGGSTYNRLDVLDLQRLKSYGAKQDVFRWAINNLPTEDNIWVLVCLHGLDDEGYLPWKSGELRQFVDLALSKGYRILSVNEFIYRKCLI